MTTEHTNVQPSDVDEAVAEQQSVSEIIPNPADVASRFIEDSPKVTPIYRGSLSSEVQTGEHEQAQPLSQQQQVHGAGDVASRFIEDSPKVTPIYRGSAFSFTEVIPLVDADVARPFTDFIEEFRQAEEARLNSPLRESVVEPFSAEEPGGRDFETRSASSAPIMPWEESIPLAAQSSTLEVKEPQEGELAQQTAQVPALQAEESASDSAPTSTEQKPAAPVRPVSPLLRPASRLRLPRHASGAGRQHGHEEPPVTEKAPPAAPLISPTAAAGRDHQTPASETASTEGQPRPGRRYRFDRPAASMASTPGQPHTEEAKENPGHSSVVAKEAKESSGQPKQTPGATQPQSPEQSLPKQLIAPETSAAHGEGTVTETSVVETPDRRRQVHNRQREQEQTPAPVPSVVTPVGEVAAPVTESAALPQTTEVALEDLPPLEYAELQRANSRRRRRRRPGDTTPTPVPVSEFPSINRGTTLTSKPAIPESLAPAVQMPLQTPAVAAPRNTAPLPGPVPTTTGQYNIVSGYTVSQMNQGNGDAGPFMSPDPSPARGSAPVRGNLRAVRAEVQRAAVYPVRTGDPALNQLANSVVQAIQAQTDRMVSELRRTNQAPANISVSLPPFPSTERVGVFVDVANLLYSARTLRISIDFAKLLDFLRGNRRLVRAQAYCPTSPQSGDDQMFLQAVKGLGYRITTKNYKTFSSGAKKADLDLDLCMDVVRLVDGGAVDCIVLVSGDSDFMPMLDYCSDHGVRVEVAAFDEAMSATLRQSCDLFINLALLEEIRS